MHFPPTRIEEKTLHTWIKAMLFNEKEAGRFVVIQGTPYWPIYMKKKYWEVFGPCGPNPSPSLRVYRMSETFPPMFTPVKGHDDLWYVYMKDFSGAVTASYGSNCVRGRMHLANTEYETDMFTGVGISLQWEGEADEDYDPSTVDLTLDDLTPAHPSPAEESKEDRPNKRIKSH